MSNIDRQRITAVKAMEALGYTFTNGGWRAPDQTAASLLDQADAMHALLVLRADKLGSCTEGSDEEAERATISGTIGAYEAKRWPDGNVPGGKG